MNTQEIDRLHDLAVGCFVEGRYQEARRAWEEILRESPFEPRALEGVQLLGALGGSTSGGSVGTDGASGSESGAATSIGEVRRLLDSGRHREALEAARALQSSNPHDPEVVEIVSTTLRKLESQPYVAGEMEQVRSALDSGDTPAASAACKRVLEIDPDHAEALGVMQALEGREPAAEDTGFSMAIPDRADAEAESGDAVETPTSGFRTADEAAHGSIFEAAEEGVAALALTPISSDAPRRTADPSDFADIEAEIGETRAGAASAPVAPRSGDDFDFEASAPGTAHPAAPTAAPRASDDLSFGDDFEDFAAERSTMPPITDPAARTAALVEEARRFLHAGRYTDAIESAARACAIDAEAAGAQDVIDEARRLQSESDRKAEELIDQAHGKLDAGDLAGAETLYKQVLGTHPTHREAMDCLAKIGSLRAAQEAAVSHPSAEAAQDQSRAASSGAKGAASIPLAEPPPAASQAPTSVGPMAGAPRSVPVPAAKSARAPSRRRSVLVYLGLAAVIALVVLSGFYVVGKMALSLVVPEPAVTTTTETRRAARAEPAAKPPAPPAAKAPAPAPKPRDPAAGHQRTFNSARSLAADGKLVEARAVLLDVVKESPDNQQAADLLASVEVRIREQSELDEMLTGIKSAYRQDRYEDALRMLYRLPPEKQTEEMERFKANAWYNNSIQYLLGGNCTEAIRCLDEVLSINPGDEGAQKLKEFANGYLSREKDGKYLRYVESLPERAIDAP